MSELQRDKVSLVTFFWGAVYNILGSPFEWVSRSQVNVTDREGRGWEGWREEGTRGREKEGAKEGAIAPAKIWNLHTPLQVACIVLQCCGV